VDEAESVKADDGVNDTIPLTDVADQLIDRPGSLVVGVVTGSL
jgi:hypothetical protein